MKFEVQGKNLLLTLEDEMDERMFSPMRIYGKGIVSKVSQDIFPYTPLLTVTIYLTEARPEVSVINGVPCEG
jgi:hypothetical protein